MNIAELAIRNKTITLVMTFVLVGAGIVSYESLGRLEDPEFTIKQALVLTRYPGASPAEVEEEVTDRIEKAVQQLGQLKMVESKSERGLSTVTVEVKDKYDKRTLPQVWDELRRKVNDVQGRLPPGTQPSVVYDDYGDVYGVYFAVTGEGYSYAELKDYVDMLQRELLLVQDVAKVELYGVQPEVVYVEMSRQKMSQLGIAPRDIYRALAAKNVVADAGMVQVGSEYIPIHPTGTFASVQQIGDLLISERSSDKLIFLRDVAAIKRGYLEPPQNKLRYDGQTALGLGISTVSGGNVVKMGEAIRQRLEELEANAPVGMQIGVIAFQSESVARAVDGFVLNLAGALVIVVAVLLIFMGLRSGLLIGAILLFTILGTLIVMDFWSIMLERISLGALIIALGMLVDNAIVVTEGILVKIQQGVDRVRAASETVRATMFPLLGATIVAVLAFTAIGLSQDSTGEYCRSLFQVILISLMMSWLLAVTVTPLLCVMFLNPKPVPEGQDPYGGSVFQAYKRFLDFALRRRWAASGLLVGLLLVSVYGFGFVQNSFFPDSTSPQFYIDYWRPQGTHIAETEKDLAEIEAYLTKIEGVESVATFVGQGALRFLLTYTPEKANSSYGQLLVTVDDYKKIRRMVPEIQRHLDERFTGALSLVKEFQLGPGGGSKIEARFRGPDAAVLRRLSAEAQAILHADGGARNIRDNWRQRIKVVRPVFSEAQARRTGITRQELARALEAAFTGTQVGVYREADRLLPIIARPPEAERADVDHIKNVQIWSPVAQRMIPLRQVVSEFQTVWEDPIIERRNRVPTITAQCDQKSGNASVLFERVRPEIEAIKLPPGHELQWGGEYENSRDAQAGLWRMLPASFLAMVLVVIFLFNALRQPLIIFLCVPLAVIGVTVGLLLTGQPFGFMALLGFLSLSGMLIKNSVVLIDQIDLEIRQGKPPLPAVLDSSVSRMRPVAMAAVTTVLGMVPLLTDAFFVAMAVTIMFGLAFATLLTLIVVPVLYAIFFRLPYGHSSFDAPPVEDAARAASP